jgi:hypothetical protein
MADNTVINLQSGGDSIATDDIAGVKVQRVKLIHGVDGVNDGDVASSNPLPVTVGNTPTVNLSATDRTKLDAAATPATQPVSGTVTATGPLTDTQLRAANVNTTLASLVYPTATGNNTVAQLAAGATFTGTAETIQNLQAAQISVVADQPVTVVVEQFLDAGATKLVSSDTFTRAASVPLNENVSLPGDYFRIKITNNGASATTTLQAGVTFGIMATGPRALTNLGNNKTAISEVGGTAVSVNSGVVDAGTQRVVLPTNQPAIPVTVSGTVTVTDGAGSITVDGVTAAGVAPAGNPVLNAGTDGTLTRSLLTDTAGRQVVVAQDASAAISIAANSTASGSVTGLTGAGTAMIQLTGTFVATAQVQVTVDGTTWVNVTGSQSMINEATAAFIASGNLTAVGVYQVDVSGATGVRVITTAYTSGTITGTVRVSPSSGMVAVQGVVPVSYSSGTFLVDTELATAAALADAAANPTTATAGAAGLVWNGATWDRQRTDNFTQNVDTSSARTATGTGATFTNQVGTNLIVWINATVVTGTTPTCQFRLQWSPDNGTTWLDLDTTNLQGTAITGVTTQLFRVGPNLTTVAGSATGGSKQDIVPRLIRLAWTIGGTTPSFTFASWFTTTG